MNKFRLFFFIFVSFCFGFVETVDAVVMVVEDNAILNSDVLQQSLYIASQKNINPYDDKEAFDSIYEEVLGLLVDNLSIDFYRSKSQVWEKKANNWKLKYIVK